MRKTALVAAGLGALMASAAPSPQAMAADQIKLGLGGKLRHYFFVADQDEAPGDDINATGMFTNAEVYFEGRTVLDNGIQIRATIELEAEARRDRNADEAYITIVSGFGNLRVGEKEGVNAAMIGDPAPQAFLTTEEELMGLAMKRYTGVTSFNAFTFKRFSDDDLTVSYETPEISGFKVGASYHPATTDIEGFVDNTIQQHNGFDVSARYDGYYTGGTYRVGGGYFHSQSSTGGNDGQEAWNAVVGVTYGGWEFSGAHMRSTPANGLDESAWTVGALYGIGPFKVSADYMWARRDAGPATVAREKVDRFTVQTSYHLGPGITVGLAGFYADQGNAAGLTYNGGGLLGGISLGF